MSKNVSNDFELIAAVEREQRLIGYELHDNICQTLAGTSMILQTIGRAIAAQKPVSAESFETLRRILNTAIEQTRALSTQFSPVQLEGAGLMQALDALVRSSSNGKLVCESPVFVSDPERALALYRIAQEALKNTTRHSQAESVEVSLSLRDGNYILKICDDGCGFIPNEDDKTIRGLRMMRKRAELLGGTLECKTAKGMGTTIMCRIPKETIDRKY